MPFTNVIVFQFSLWDSKNTRTLFKHNKVSFNSLYEIRENTKDQNWNGSINFQFSLWDSSWRHIRYVSWHCHLSILFMRFSRGEHEHVNPKEPCFQFSLWDSQFIDCLSKEMKGLTFNSLYEIPYLIETDGTYVWANFQFSLWDSWRKLVWAVTMLSLSFNSLYEIQWKLKLNSLTIKSSFNSLYEIRMLGKWCSAKINPSLSILFMRFS